MSTINWSSSISSSSTTGAPLEDVRLPGGPMGLFYDKSALFSSGPLRADRPTLLFARGASVFELQAPPPAGVVRLETTTVALVPANCTFQVTGQSSLSELLRLQPSDELLERTADAYNISRESMRRVFACALDLPRTVWVSELGHRYFFERLVCRKHDTLASAFLEMEICKEIFFLGSKTGVATVPLPYLFDLGTTTKRALAFIEAHLFEPLSVERIVSETATSRSSLLRAFRKDIGKSPSEVIHDRRLEEAMTFLRSGRYPVGEVAFLVGYENFSAFSQAFRRKYGRTPSQAAAGEAGEFVRPADGATVAVKSLESGKGGGAGRKPGRGRL